MARLARSISHLDVHLAPWSSEALLATADRPDQLGRESCVIAKSFANSQSSNGRRMMDVERLTSPKDRSYSLYETAIASTPLYRLYFCGHKSSYAPPCGCAGSGWGKDLYFFIFIYFLCHVPDRRTQRARPLLRSRSLTGLLLFATTAYLSTFPARGVLRSSIQYSQHNKLQKHNRIHGCTHTA